MGRHSRGGYQLIDAVRPGRLADRVLQVVVCQGLAGQHIVPATRYKNAQVLVAGGQHVLAQRWVIAV